MERGFYEPSGDNDRDFTVGSIKLDVGMWASEGFTRIEILKYDVQKYVDSGAV